MPIPCLQLRQGIAAHVIGYGLELVWIACLYSEFPCLTSASWDHWQGQDGGMMESVAIITTAANELMQAIHDRMPVILNTKSLAAWIDPETGREEVTAVLASFPPKKMKAYPVSSWVNNPRHDGPECLATT